MKSKLKINQFNIKAYRTLPGSLKPSDYVDFLLFLNGDKKCVRIGINNKNTYVQTANWCNRHGYRFYISKNALMYIANNIFTTRFAAIVDDSLIPHAAIFGRILGYPKCCYRKISSIGEENIDVYEKKLCSAGDFEVPFDKINPSLYLEGKSLISHIPCSCNCKKSLEIANHTYDILCRYKDERCFKQWIECWKIE